jgi:hypothetical protein
MATDPKNIAFPAVLAVICAFLLLLVLVFWFSDKTGDPDRAGQAPPTSIVEVQGDPPTGVQSSTRRGAAPVAESQGRASAAGTGAAQSRSAAEGEAETWRRAEEANSAPGTPLESRDPLDEAAPGAVPGGSPGSQPSSTRRAANEGSAATGEAGSTFVAIPPDQPVAPASLPEVESAAVREEERPIEEEEPPEPLSEPPESEERRRPEPQAEKEPPDSTPFVQLSPSPSVLAVGGHLAVGVLISGASDVGHVPFHLLYNSQVLQFEYGEEGLFLGSNGGQTAFFAAPASSSGAVVVGLSRLGGGEGASGGGQLCVLHFTAIGPGAAGFAFSREKVRDSGNSIMPAIFVPAEVIVQE